MIYNRIGRYKKIIALFYKIIIIFIIACIIGDTYVKIKNKDYEMIYNSANKINSRAIIISDVEETEYKKIYSIKLIDEKKNKKFILKIDKKIKQDFKYGDLVYLEGEYESPSVARNFKGFDYLKYLKSQNTYGIINANKINLIEEKQINLILQLINKIRNSIINNANSLINDKNLSALLIGILIGDTSNIEEETINSFKNSSLSHMLAVSGQHVGYITLAINFALSITKMGKRNGKIVSIGILILFMLVTGCTPSVFRAGTMGILMIIASLLHKKSDIYTSLALSMILILGKNPFAIYNIGLWLSYRRGAWNCTF